MTRIQPSLGSRNGCQVPQEALPEGAADVCPVEEEEEEGIMFPF